MPDRGVEDGGEERLEAGYERAEFFALLPHNIFFFVILSAREESYPIIRSTSYLSSVPVPC